MSAGALQDYTQFKLCAPRPSKLRFCCRGPTFACITTGSNRAFPHETRHGHGHVHGDARRDSDLLLEPASAVVDFQLFFSLLSNLATVGVIVQTSTVTVTSCTYYSTIAPAFTFSPLALLFTGIIREPIICSLLASIQYNTSTYQET